MKFKIDKPMHLKLSQLAPSAKFIFADQLADQAADMNIVFMRCTGPYYVSLTSGTLLRITAANSNRQVHPVEAVECVNLQLRKEQHEVSG